MAADGTVDILGARSDRAFRGQCQNFVVDNRGGANAMIARHGAKASPDGYTLWENITGRHQRRLRDKMAYDLHKDLAPISLRPGFQRSGLPADPSREEHQGVDCARQSQPENSRMRRSASAAART